MLQQLFPPSLETPISDVEARFAFSEEETRRNLQEFFLMPFPQYKQTLATWLLPLTKYDTKRSPKDRQGLTISDRLNVSKSCSQTCVISLIGPPGVGKTASLVHEATKRFVIFMTSAEGRNAGCDPNWTTFMSQLSTRETQLRRRYEQSKSPDFLRYHEELRVNASNYCCLYVIVRILFFVWLRGLVPTLTEKQFFLAQLNGPSRCQADAFLRLLDDTNLAQSELVLYDLWLWLKKEKITLTIVIDDAQLLMTPSNYLSLRALYLLRNHSSMLSVIAKDFQPKINYSRGLLSILVSKISNCFSTVLSGTQLSLSHADFPESSIGVPDTVLRVHQFPYLTERQIWKRLRTFLNLDSCSPSDNLRLLTGRFRWADMVVSNLYSLEKAAGSKKQIFFEETINSTIELVKREISSLVSAFVQSSDFSLLFLFFFFKTIWYDVWSSFPRYTRSVV